MNYYAITINSLPKIMFSHTYKANKYNISFDSQEDTLEMTYITKGVAKKIFDDNTLIVIKEKTLSLHCMDKKSTIYSETEHCHTTVSFNVKYSYIKMSESTAKSFIKNKQFDSSLIIIPEYIDIPDNPIEIFAKSHTSLSVSRDYYCCGLLFLLLNRITQQTINILSGDTLNNNIITKTKKYIYDNISVDIYLDDISTFLGISVGYLSHQFKMAVGISINQYIISVKIEHIKGLLLKNISLKSAGEAVSIFDQSYVSRLFKKQTGLSASEFIKKYKGF